MYPHIGEQPKKISGALLPPPYFQIRSGVTRF